MTSIKKKRTTPFASRAMRNPVDDAEPITLSCRRSRSFVLSRNTANNARKDWSELTVRKDNVRVKISILRN